MSLQYTGMVLVLTCGSGPLHMHGSYKSNFNIGINFLMAFYHKLYFKFIYFWNVKTTAKRPV
jgi:hypothetical protein